MPKHTALAGHALQNEGAPWTAASCTQWPCDKHPGVVRVGRRGESSTYGVAGQGHALCECGWTGKHELSGAERRRAHLDHKDKIRKQSA